MSFKKILIPTDGSEHSDLAIEKGIELAKIAGSEITLLFVKDRSIYMQSMVGTNLEDIDKVRKIEQDNVIKEARDRNQPAGVACSERNSAVSEEYDLIVMGTAGRTGLKKMLMGSVTQFVIVNSRCPVMAVRITE
ncbi:MAG: universal stress protein [archaeon]|nr:universal stress protein [archaeon]